jgi:hypothetical protein
LINFKYNFGEYKDMERVNIKNLKNPRARESIYLSTLKDTPKIPENMQILDDIKRLVDSFDVKYNNNTPQELLKFTGANISQPRLMLEYARDIHSTIRKIQDLVIGLLSDADRNFESAEKQQISDKIKIIQEGFRIALQYWYEAMMTLQKGKLPHETMHFWSSKNSEALHQFGQKNVTDSIRNIAGRGISAYYDIASRNYTIVRAA